MTESATTEPVDAFQKAVEGGDADGLRRLFRAHPELREVVN